MKEKIVRGVAQSGSASRLWREGHIKLSMFVVYILYSEKLKVHYVGSTNDLVDRLKRHNSGEGNFTKKGIPWVLIKSIACESRSDAVRLERKVKKRGIKRFLEDSNSGRSAVR